LSSSKWSVVGGKGKFEKKQTKTNSTQEIPKKSVGNPPVQSLLHSSNSKQSAQKQTQGNTQTKSDDPKSTKKFTKIEVKYKCKWCRKKLLETCFSRSRIKQR